MCEHKKIKIMLEVMSGTAEEGWRLKSAGRKRERWEMLVIAVGNDD